MKFKVLTAALLAQGLALLCGCASHPHGAYAPQYVSEPTLESSAKFVLLDPGAQKSVTCKEIQETRLQDGRMQVAANLMNLENRRIQVQVNCVFKDAQGFTVEDTPFQNFFLDENALEGIKFVSANDKAQRYTIRVREAR